METKEIKHHLIYPNVDIYTDEKDRFIALRTWLRMEHEGKYYLIPFYQEDKPTNCTDMVRLMGRLHKEVYFWLQLGEIDPKFPFKDARGSSMYYLDADQRPETERLRTDYGI